MRLLFSLWAFAIPLLLQGQTADRQAFDVASVKPSPPDGPSRIGPTTGGGLRAEGITLKSMIAWAYGVQGYQISGGPAWVDSTRWSILAKPPAVASPAAELEYEKMTDADRASTMSLVKRRTQALLEERFRLAIRREPREQTVYALSIAKQGVRMKESEDQSKSDSIQRGHGLIVARNCRMALLAQFLGADMDRPVLDRTGLTGHFDFRLEFTPESASAEAGEPGSSLTTAVQDQLGLRLGLAKVAVDTLLIQKAEMASEN